MATDPVLAYAGPESRSINVLVILFNGGAATVRGVIANAETSAGEASAAFADAGPLAWIAYDGDPLEIEFCQYAEPGTDRTLHRRATKRERTSAHWNTVKLNMSVEATVIAQRGSFSPLDFSPEDYST